MILFNKCYINLLFGLMVTFDVWKGLLFTSFLMIVVLLIVISKMKARIEGTKRSVYLRESPKMMEEPRIEIVR